MNSNAADVLNYMVQSQVYLQEEHHRKIALEEVSAEEGAISIEETEIGLLTLKMPLANPNGKVQKGLADQSFKAVRTLLMEL